MFLKAEVKTKELNREILMNARKLRDETVANQSNVYLTDDVPLSVR